MYYPELLPRGNEESNKLSG